MHTLNPKTLHHSLRTSAWLSLFTSSSTLLCCALPATLVALGAGATLSSLVTAVPQLVWLSEHKIPLFIIATLMLTLASWLQWRARGAACACLRAHTTGVALGHWVFMVDVGGGRVVCVYCAVVE